MLKCIIKNVLFILFTDSNYTRTLLKIDSLRNTLKLRAQMNDINK